MALAHINFNIMLYRASAALIIALAVLGRASTGAPAQALPKLAVVLVVDQIAPTTSIAFSRNGPAASSAWSHAAPGSGTRPILTSRR